jgi:predicted PurR-regulated permease PerM
METSKMNKDSGIPEELKKASDWAWRILVILAALSAIVFLAHSVWNILSVFLLSILLTAGLGPLAKFLRKKWNWPKWLSIVAAELGAITALVGLVTLSIWQISKSGYIIKDKLVPLIDSASNFLKDKFDVDLGAGDSLTNYLLKSFQSDAEQYASGALGFVSSVTQTITGVILAAIITLFLLIDGENIARWFMRFIPKASRSRTWRSGVKAWSTLNGWVKAQVIVAFIDCLGIGVGALIMGLPFVLPITILTFFGAFIPFFGAFIAGFFAVFVALVWKGWIAALIMLSIVILVQQVEGHILQPFVMGSAVSVHPLAVILVVLIGTTLGGVIGAILSVPAVAFLNNFFVEYTQLKSTSKEIEP